MININVKFILKVTNKTKMANLQDYGRSFECKDDEVDGKVKNKINLQPANNRIVGSKYQSAPFRCSKQSADDHLLG